MPYPESAVVKVSPALDSEVPSNNATALARTFRTDERDKKELCSQLSLGVLAVALRGAASSDAATKAKPRSPAATRRDQNATRPRDNGDSQPLPLGQDWWVRFYHPVLLS